MLKEFKAFLMRGNVMDLAVAVIIAGAFGAIVTSLVNDIFMPIIGTIVGKSFATLSMEINGVNVQYGLFIQAVVNFVIIGAVIFAVVKAAAKMDKKKVEAPAAPPAPTADQLLLTEIRDLLKK